MNKSSYYYKIYFSVIGLFLINFSYFLSFYYRFDSFDFSSGYSHDGIGYDYIFVLFNLIFLLSSKKASNFLFSRKSVFSKILSASIQDTILLIMGYGAFIMIVKGAWFSREFILVFSILYFISLLFLRLILFSFYRHQIELSRKDRKVIIFGDFDDIDYIMKEIIEQDVTVSHIFCYDKEPNHYNQYYINQSKEFFSVVSSENQVNEAILVHHGKKSFYKIYQRCLDLGIRVRIIPNFYREIETRFSLEENRQTPILKLQVEPLEDPFNSMIKRAFDIVFSGVVLITIFPILMLIFGLIIKLTSKGAIFFKQTRSGLNHSEFTCWKFRTMKVIDQRQADKIQASKDDPRITWIGKFMRRTNLDEFPQFINVLLGDMSIVGPRPHPLSLNEKFGNKLSFYMTRHQCKPGVTGWAQANGYRGETKEDFLMEKRIEFDRYYIYHWTFWLDIKIIFLTVWKMLSGDEQAY